MKLPNITMAQVVVSRQIKRLLTGDLDAPVPSFPPFPGTERNLLRALVARIVGATLISPDGFFELSEDEPPVRSPAHHNGTTPYHALRCLFRWLVGQSLLYHPWSLADPSHEAPTGAHSPTSPCLPSEPHFTHTHRRRVPHPSFVSILPVLTSPPPPLPLAHPQPYFTPPYTHTHTHLSQSPRWPRRPRQRR